MANQNSRVSPEEFQEYLQLLLQIVKSKSDINIDYSILKTQNKKLIEQFDKFDYEVSSVIAKVLADVTDSMQVLSEMPNKYEVIYKKLVANPPFGEKMSIETDLQAYRKLINECFEIESSCNLIKKPSAEAKQILTKWGIDEPFKTGSERYSKIDKYIEKLDYMKKDPYFKPVQPYYEFIIKNLNEFKKSKNH